MHANELYAIRETDVENCISEVHLRARMCRASLLKIGIRAEWQDYWPHVGKIVDINNR